MVAGSAGGGPLACLVTLVAQKVVKGGTTIIEGELHNGKIIVFFLKSVNRAQLSTHFVKY